MKFHRTILIVLFLGCDGGLLLAPDVEPGIEGVIRFAPGTWPSSDSLQGLWLFAAREYPLDSSRIITGVLIEPRSIFLYPSLSESLPLFRDSVTFTFTLTPGVYKYVGVIQQLRPELLVKNFRVVAVWDDPLGSQVPRTLDIRNGNQIRGARLTVNFNQPPPQPYRSWPE